MVGLRLTSRVGPKGQAVIPKAVRDHMGIAPGDQVSFRVEGNHVVFEKRAAEAALDEFLGALKRKKRAPRRVDWDRRYYAQFRRRTR